MCTATICILLESLISKPANNQSCRYRSAPARWPLGPVWPWFQSAAPARVWPVQVHLRACKVQTNTGPPPRPPVGANTPPSAGANATAHGGKSPAGGRPSGVVPGRPAPSWPWLHFSVGKQGAAAAGRSFEEAQAASLSCLRRTDAELAAKFLHEFDGSWPPPAIANPLSVAMSRVAQCSEFMMVPAHPSPSPGLSPNPDPSPDPNPGPKPNPNPNPEPHPLPLPTDYWP